MKHLTIDLSVHFPSLKNSVDLISYCPDVLYEMEQTRKRPTVLILPGGGYEFVSEREGEPIALRLNSEGVNAFVLKYNVAPYEYPYPLIEGFAALSYLRNHLKEYNIDENKIVVMGFSAGGHFAASLSAYYQNEEFAQLLNVKLSDFHINGTILAYPVISTTLQTHLRTIENITNRKKELIGMFSIEKHVHKYFPKTFIWTTHEDSVVNSEHSLLLANALKGNNVPFELHYYPFGDHGTSLANEIVYPADTPIEVIEKMSYFSSWIDLAIKFIKKVI